MIHFSVIVCTYNRSGCLRHLLGCFERLLIPEGLSWELIVVDNNSTDETRQIVSEVQRTNGLPIKYIFEGRQGKSHASNTGIGEAKGEILVFTDDDVSLHPNWLSDLKEIFDRFDCIGVGGRIIPRWMCKKPSWLIEDGPFALMKITVAFDFGGTPFELTTPPFGANMAFRKVAFEKYGLFRTDLGRTGDSLMGLEDSELCLRIMKHGERVVYAPKAIVYHPVDKARSEKSYYKNYYFNFGRSWIRMEGFPKTAICILGVPRYFVRKLLEKFLRWVVTLDLRRRFYYKLQLYQTAGEILELYIISKNTKT